MDLKDWAIEFVKAMDANKKEIKKIEETKKGFILHKEPEDIVCFILKKSDKLENLQLNDGKMNIFLLNSKANLEQVLKDWKHLIKFPFLKIFFVNPNSKHDKKWILSPYMHNRISEPDKIKQGLCAMFATVESVD